MTNIDTLTGQTKAFAEACFDDNSLAELLAPHTPADADTTDCETWHITPAEWSAAIEAALLERMGD